MEILVVVFSWLLFGGASSYFASGRGRDPFAWFLIGMLLGILGLLLLFLLPPIVEEPQEKEIIPEEPDIIQKEPSSRLKTWFYLDEKSQQLGPYSYQEFKRVWKQGKISLQTLVWSEGMTDWKPIGEVSDLKHELQ